MTTYYSEGLRRRAMLKGGVGLVAAAVVGTVAVRATFGGDAAAAPGSGTGPDGDPAGTTTPNGWPVLEIGGTRTVRVAGRELLLRPGPVTVVLAAFVRRFDAEVERVGRGEVDDWSYAKRAVRGAVTVWSEHAAGTAVDLNATAHVRGSRRTFSAPDRRALGRLLDDFAPVVTWGGSFDVPDEMHFEIAVPPGSKALTRLAARLG